MSGKINDITGVIYGKLTVLSHERIDNIKWAICKCDYGETI